MQQVESNTKFSTDSKTLISAVIAGISTYALQASIFSDIVPFSIFILFSFMFSFSAFYRGYSSSTTSDLLLVAVGSFFVGFLGYSALLHSAHPELGSNFITLILGLVIFFWVAKKIGWMDKKGEKAEA